MKKKEEKRFLYSPEYLVRVLLKLSKVYFIHSFIHSTIHSPTDSFIHAFVFSFVVVFYVTLAYLSVRSSIYWLFGSVTRSFLHLSIYSGIPFLVGWLSPVSHSPHPLHLSASSFFSFLLALLILESWSILLSFDRVLFQHRYSWRNGSDR